jgi:iron-sulfur cluster assembly accessory protein
MSVKITEKAALEVVSIVAEKQIVNPILRVGINGGGCSGFEYSLDFEKEGFVPSKMDTVYEQHGVKFVVDKKSDLYLDGTTIDFKDGINERGFAFENPNAVKSCGCGKSFQA